LRYGVEATRDFKSLPKIALPSGEHDELNTAAVYT